MSEQSVSEKMSTIDPMLPLLFPLLHAFPAANRQALLALGVEHDAPAGTVLWEEGQLIPDLLLISSGIVVATSNGEVSHRPFLYGHMSAGSVAGLHALFTSEAAQVQLTVQADAHYLQLPRAALVDALRDYPAAWEAVANELAQGVFHLVNTINLLAQSNGYHRLRRLLIQLDRRARNEYQQSGLMLSQQELAARIGLSREMVNRMLAQLRNGGYIEQDERGVFKILQTLPHEF
ncbi:MULTISPECIES: Crp/Fnr family transcriptional regulator [Deefgea]|uniref:Helix-turn-helix domain-containing protein n=1 Tax=Deefgea chitinilytica TaxID=570276 RepID=A0ABS2CBS8_9NEIS|nr:MULTISPECIES: Crp/Fnr family transcriptional regulator [Deefgea]MBM5570801.1 helix-turn-helix domain-containing protein [Deefgea chitinilytica]MBM9888030.1 Crp/Fnr family transcriptional regulator [Deefgea sp. CFH1-16]